MKNNNLKQPVVNLVGVAYMQATPTTKIHDSLFTLTSVCMQKEEKSHPLDKE